MGAPTPIDPAEAIGPAIDATALFAPLSADERRRLAAGAKLLQFAEGETLVREGDTTSSMFLIAAGRAAVSVHANGGASRGIAVLEAGAAFGEISLLTGEPRLATVRALTEITLVEIDKQTFAPVLEANPSLVEKLDAVILERRRYTADRKQSAADAGASGEPESLRDRIARFFGLKGP
jgi:CRP-like cAMP-binding protein